MIIRGLRKMKYDYIIIGMGPAGVSAAIYAKRAGLKVLCLDKGMIGGYLNFIDSVDNYPGYKHITGPDLAYQMYEQMQDLKIEYKNEEVRDILVVDDVKKVITNKSVYETSFVLIATGRISSNLGLEHEEELLGKGISHCALCDGNFYKDKDVAVIGNGEGALREAIYLSGICKSVYLINRFKNYRAPEVVIEQIMKRENILKLNEIMVKEIIPNEGVLGGIVLSDGTKLKLEGMFIYAGYKPGTNFKTNLEIMNEKGYINVNCYGETTVAGVYAAGDVVNKEVYQIVTAVAEGAIATLDIIKKIKQLEK